MSWTLLLPDDVIETAATALPPDSDDLFALRDALRFEFQLAPAQYDLVHSTISACGHTNGITERLMQSYIDLCALSIQYPHGVPGTATHNSVRDFVRLAKRRVGLAKRVNGFHFLPRAPAPTQLARAHIKPKFYDPLKRLA